MRLRAGGATSRPAPDPRESGGLIGRSHESAALRHLLGAHRLVTVTGFAGIGKSRLADCTLGSWDTSPWRRIVRVRWDADVTGPASLAEAAAAALGAAPGTDPRPADLAALCGTERSLLLLDDVDPVQAECTRLVQQLLMAVPGLRVLVTARRPLGLGEEQVLRLSALPVDVPAGATGPAPAVRLFVERARDSAEELLARDPESARVEEVCRLVEGVPLAIELAADQLDRYSLDDLAARLRQGQGWLTSSYPALRRHQSVRDAVGASYQLCERALRVVWARSSVFTGSFTEASAVAVASGGGIDAQVIPSCLTQLTALGVLRATGDPGGVRRPRYRMTRAAREFGASRLTEAGEYPVAASRRTQHFQQVAAHAGRCWDSGDQLGAVRLVRDEQDDLLATAHHALEHPDPEHTDAALDTIVSVWFWWLAHGHAATGLDLLARLLPLCEPTRPSAVRGTWLAAWLAVDTDPAAARAFLAAAWPGAVLSGDDVTLGRVAHVEGMLALRQGDARAAAAHFADAAELIPAFVPGGPSPAVSLSALALVQAEHSPRAALRAARRAVSWPGVRDDAWANLVANYARARVDAAHGRPGRAWHRARRALDAGAAPPGHPTGPGHTALLHLIAELESGTSARPAPDPLFVPHPRPSHGPLPADTASQHS
ncbi:ATP-binding protein [Streptomyces xanthii]|uniref:NB-ARC domain-containing protein n=1 Tax=Streptomyces xanthii TaxID=2768069 RepID=A0A7H1BGT3_9ACTN|nr:hypothetical protein [Streptomyces xanthii]QNS07938.1 hypothetical protein IAG42_32900 [Streptomyces xanthii]